MKPLHSMLTVAVLTISTTCGVWAANPCMPIAQACMKEGYYKGGQDIGKGLVEDCVKPVVMKQKTLSNASFDEPALEACQTMLAKRGA